MKQFFCGLIALLVAFSASAFGFGKASSRLALNARRALINARRAARQYHCTCGLCGVCNPSALYATQFSTVDIAMGGIPGDCNCGKCRSCRVLQQFSKFQCKCGVCAICNPKSEHHSSCACTSCLDSN